MLSLKLQDFSAQAGWCKVAAAVLFFIMALIFLVQLKSDKKRGEREMTCSEGSQVVFELWATAVRTCKGFYLLLSYL